MDLILTSLLPFLLLMVLGYLVKMFGWVKSDSWISIETLSFKVFMPALVINAIVSSQSSLSEMATFLFVFVGSVLLVAMASLSLRLFISKEALTNASLSTIFQTTTRWNPFIIWPIIELLYGQEGVGLLSITIAVFVPLVNIMNIVVVSVLNRESLGDKAINGYEVVWLIFKNPIFIGCMIGLVLRYGNIDLPVTIETTIRRLGECALVMIILAIGANLDLRLLLKRNQFVLISVSYKMMLLPLVFLAGAVFANFNSMLLFCGLLMAAVPTASNGYIIAKQMGGDAPLYATILTWQIVLSLFLLPVLVKLQSVFG